MTVYKVKSTRKTKAAISINENEIDNSIAVKLFGRKRLAYGEDLNENLLHLLESFSCPRLASSSTPVPDTSKASDNMFDNPVEGQLWYDSTPLQETLFVFNGTGWAEQNKFGDIAANWGVIAHGGQIPLPISPNGRTYTYAECSWIVSPYGYPNTIDFMNCRTDANAVVTMQYSLENNPTVAGGFANYMIIGIPGNVNLGSLAPEVSVTPTPTVTATPTPTRENTPTPTSSLSSTPTPTPTKGVTPTPSPSSSSGGVAVSPTPEASVTAAPTETPTPTPTTSVSPTPGVTATPTPTESTTPTPSTSVSPSPSQTPSPSITPTATPTPLPVFGMTIVQGDGSQYGDGLVMTASNGASCVGFCGTGLGFAPAAVDSSKQIGIIINGGVAPFTVWVDTWSVDPSSTNTMFGENLKAQGNFSGADVTGNPLNNPSWTWTGGSTAGIIQLSGSGNCAYNDRNITGSAVIHIADSASREITQSVGWQMIRTANSGDAGCGGGGVTLTGGAFSGFDDNQPGSAAGYRLTSTGLEQGREGTVGYTLPIGTWTTNPPANYEVRCTISSGVTPSGSAVNSWLPLSANQSWFLIAPTPGSLYVTEFLIEIRLISSGSVVDSALVNLSSQWSGSAPA